jgi:predicted transcriptional regulator
MAPNKPKTPTRTVRVDDELWDRALALAEQRGESLSDVMRLALSDYVERYGDTPTSS